MRAFMPAIAMTMIGMAVLLTAILFPSPPEKMMAVFAPGTSQTDISNIVYGSGAAVVGPARLSNAIILQSTDPDITEKLRQQGAWLVVNAEHAGGCSGRQKGKINEPV